MNKQQSPIHDRFQICNKDAALEEVKSVVNYNGKRVLELIEKCIQCYTDKHYDTCLRYSECIIDIAWEKLNTGYWKDVPSVWRKIYTCGSIYKAAAYCSQGLYQESIQTADYGLLLGAPILDDTLNSIIKAAAVDGFQEEKYCCSEKSKRKAEIHTGDQFNNSSNDIQQLLDSRRKRRNLVVNSQTEIPHISCPSLNYFKQYYYDQKKPTIITDAIDHWPALNNRKWSLQRIKEIAGHRTVPIEIGARYTEKNWSQDLMTISEFIDNFIDTDEQGVGYLAQHQLFDQIPELQADICIPDYCCIVDEENQDPTVLTNAWFGPRGTISPLHHDPYHNLFAQVIGEKFIRLYDERETENVYPYSDKLLANTSQINVESPDFQKYPKFSQASYVECILKSGQLLYIPPKCWHYVRSLDISFSISFWW